MRNSRFLNESKYDRYRDELISSPYEDDEVDNIEKFNKMDAWQWFKVIDWRKFRVFDSNINLSKMKKGKIKPEYVRQGKAYFQWYDEESDQVYLGVMTKDNENDFIEFILRKTSGIGASYYYKYIMREDGNNGKWFKCKEREFMIASKKYKNRDNLLTKESLTERAISDDPERVKIEAGKNQLDIAIDVNNFCYNRKGENLEVVYSNGRKEVDYDKHWVYLTVYDDSREIFKYNIATCKLEKSIGSLGRLIRKLIGDYIIDESLINESALKVDKFGYYGSYNNEPFPDGSAKGDMTGSNKCLEVTVAHTPTGIVGNKKECYTVIAAELHPFEQYEENAIAYKDFNSGQKAIEFANKLLGEVNDSLYDLRKVAQKYKMTYENADKALLK